MDDDTAQDIEKLKANARVIIEKIGPLYDVELGFYEVAVATRRLLRI